MGWAAVLLMAFAALAGPITLPLPIYLENFDSTPEGGLPAGWSRTNYSTLPQSNSNLLELASTPYAGWLVVDRSRFTSNFLAYTSHQSVDYSRVLSFNPANVVNGQTVTNLANGKFLFCTSGWREGNQVQYVFSPAFDLTGRTNIHVSYHSIFEQNQDNFGAVEYSVNGGATWLPVVYMIDGPDMLTTSGATDALKTLTNRAADIATYVEPGSGLTKGGYFGTFIGVASNLWSTLAPYLSARVNDDPVESKRVELFRLSAADNQPSVRFRFAHAGTDSWYFGIDDFGLYSITPGTLPIITKAPSGMNVSAGAAATFNVETTGPGLTYQWRLNGTNISGATNATFIISSADSNTIGVYTVVVANESGAIESAGASLTTYIPIVTGQWDFDAGDLRATVGQDLEYRGDTAAITTFSEITISNQPARVMNFSSNDVSQGFYMRHGAAPNCGGQFVNQYTLVMDVMYPAASTDQWRALFQTDPFNRPGNDADYYVGDNTTLPDPNAPGAAGQFHGPLAPDTWHRVAFTVDLAAPPERRLTKYINGTKTATHAIEDGLDGRYALGPTAQLFTSGLAGQFTRPGYANSIQFINGWLPDSAIATLGGPTADGIPPGDAVLKISQVQLNGNLLTLSWTGGAGLFQIEKATTVTSPDWQPFNLPTSNHAFITIALGSNRAFYRVKKVIPPVKVGPQPDGKMAVATAQLVRAAGQFLQFGGRPVDLALSPDGKLLYVKKDNGLLIIDANTWTLLQQLNFAGSGASMHGVAVSANGSRVYTTGSGNELYEATIATNGNVSWSRTIALPGSSDPCGIALSADGTKAFVCLSRLNTLAVVNLQTGTLIRQINVGIAPFDVVLSPNENIAYVSDWGGRKPIAGDLTAGSAGTQVVVDNRGIGASGIVSFVDLTQNLETAKVPTGLHPSDLELSSDGQTLYVANANSDTVALINTANATVRETVLVRPDPTLPFGSAPNALALSRDGKNLFVANGGNNAIAVIELPNAQHTNSLVQGFIPTDWYPGGVVADSNTIYVANIKGLGTRNAAPGNSVWQIGQALGTANKIPIPSSETLGKYTAIVHEDAQVPQALRALVSGQSGQAPVPVPARIGEPSVFQHVVYILKENKTYDQMFGDLPLGNSEPSLCVFPRFVSPNHHALAEQFVLLDNFYCNGVLSADGHSWSTEGNVTDHLEKSFGGFVRSYTFGDDALTYSSSGFIWDNVLLHGLSFRNYGEFDYASPVPANATWQQIYRDFTNGTPTIRYTQNIGVAPLRPYSSTNVPGWNMGIPDVVRAAGFIKELNAAQAAGSWPNFHFLYLPNDHTSGTSPNFPTPRAQVADNDLALGQVVDAISHSIFWSNTVIFVIEDDPQSGYDHVDGHRSICLVISPYTKRGAVISKFYNQTGVLHTMERILGIPPMNQMDALSPLMTDCFIPPGGIPNFQPYTKLANNVALDEMNPGSTANLPKKERYWAEKSLQLDLKQPDRADDDTLNRIVWHSVKGVDAKYPARFAGAHGKGLKKLNLVLTGEEDDD